MIERSLLTRTAELAADHLAAIGDPLPETGVPPEQVVEELARGAEPGLVASPGPRYFGFVIGGVLPAALAADWLTTAWNKKAFSGFSSPAASVGRRSRAGGCSTCCACRG